MPRPAPPKDLNLKSLELFQICAERGSLKAVASETGLTISTVSHHLRNLEDHLGTALFDHTRRPMVLTPKGQAFLRNIDEALTLIRRAKSEASAGGPNEARLLRIGAIEDLDSDVLPELALSLRATMPGCTFHYHTDSSHALIEMLRNRRLDFGIATASTERLHDLQSRPVLRDPFMMVVPAHATEGVSAIIEGDSALPFLRFSSELLISRQIDAQFRRLKIASSTQLECNNTQTLLAMVAAGAGWTISTPLLFARARRFHDGLAIHPFPGKSFSRTVSLIAAPDCAQSIGDLVEGELRNLLERHLVGPLCETTPWLRDSFYLVAQQPA